MDRIKLKHRFISVGKFMCLKSNAKWERISYSWKCFCFLRFSHHFLHSLLCFYLFFSSSLDKCEHNVLYIQGILIFTFSERLRCFVHTHANIIFLLSKHFLSGTTKHHYHFALNSHRTNAAFTLDLLILDDFMNLIRTFLVPLTLRIYWNPQMDCKYTIKINVDIMNRESAHVKDIKTARKKSMRCELVLQNVMESERHFPLFRQIFRCENRINVVLWDIGNNVGIHSMPTCSARQHNHIKSNE